MRPRQTRYSLALLVTAFLLIGTGSAPIVAQPLGTPTNVRVYAAFGPGGVRPGVAVTSRVPGECFAASLADQSREDAWRCMSGNRILDPCFAGFVGSQQVLACPESPWAPRVTLLTPTKVPAAGSANKASLGVGLPWALELSSGVRCVFMTGATAAVAGMRINYGCVGNAQTVVGDINRSLPQWRAFVDEGQGVSVDLEAINVAWY